MSNEKAPTGEATPMGAGVELTAGKASNSYPYYTPAPRGCQVAALLSHGKSHGVKSSDLAAAVGVDNRELRRRIRMERLSGAMILSSTETGYYLASDVDELKEFVSSMRHRAREIAEVTRTAENALAEATGQTVMEGW